MCRDLPPIERAIQFHGHVCPGLLMGVRAAQHAMDFLGINPDEDEEIVAIVEHKSCGVDAIQAVLSCTLGKGNLFHRDYGKMVYIVGDRQSGRALRMAQKIDRPRSAAYVRWGELRGRELLSPEEETEKEMLLGEVFEELMTMPLESLYDWEEISLVFPEKARIEPTVQCPRCLEGVQQSKLLQSDQGLVCPACFNELI